MSITINITGGTFKHKSLALSAAVTKNFWPQLQKNSTAKSPYVLECFPGKKLFGTVAGSRDRGMLEHKDILYKVTDTTLYSVDTSGTHSALGTIPGAARCIIKGIQSNIIIVTEGLVYVWNGVSLALSAVTDPDLESPNSVGVLNSFAIYDGDDGRFAVADVGDATSIDALNYAAAESDADDLIRVYVHDQKAYMMGSKTIEPWWNSGVGKPPFDRLEGELMSVGLGALHSVANSKDYVYFIGDDNLAYAMRSGQAAPVFNDAVAAEISEFALISDAIGMCYKINGQWFYEVTFPTANRTFCYPEGGEVFELASGDDCNIASSYSYYGRKHLVGDSTSGNIYQLDLNTYTENGEPIIRTRDSAPLHGGLFNASGKTLIMNRFQLILEPGVGILVGQGINPQVMLSFSDDSGKSFSAEMWATVGKLGQFQWGVEWFALGQFESRIIRVRVSDPVHWSIHSSAADIEICI